MICTENSIHVDYDVSLNDNHQLIDEDTQMTSSIIAKRKTDSNMPNFTNLCSMNNIFEFGSQSLLIDNKRQPVGLFSQGDRYVPMRPDDILIHGEQKFMHEENLIFNKKERNDRREERR